MAIAVDCVEVSPKKTNGIGLFTTWDSVESSASGSTGFETFESFGAGREHSDSLRRLSCRESHWPRPSGHRSGGAQGYCMRCQVSELSALHESLLRGLAGEREPVLKMLLPWLCKMAKARVHCEDPTMVSDAANDAVAAYWLKPESFDSGRGVPLDSYLLNACVCNLRDRIKTEARRRARELHATKTFFDNFVELCGSASNTYLKARPEFRLLIEFLERLEEQVLLDPLDRAFVALWKDNEIHSGAFAKLLGNDQLSLEAQKRLVKRTKDRIAKALRRAWARDRRWLEEEV
jgi:hypothetical protein